LLRVVTTDVTTCTPAMSLQGNDVTGVTTKSTPGMVLAHLNDEGPNDERPPSGNSQ
jgi:hypothetical protein